MWPQPGVMTLLLHPTAYRAATDEQLVTLYSNLYRLNLYPSSYTETDADGASVHASPVLDGAPVRPGEMYVNHGFWDTYRTCWPAYALLYPEVAARLAGVVRELAK